MHGGAKKSVVNKLKKVIHEFNFDNNMDLVQTALDRHVVNRVNVPVFKEDTNPLRLERTLSDVSIEEI